MSNAIKTLIKKTKESAIFYDGKFYDTDKELNLSFSEAFRLTRIANTEASYDSVGYDPTLWRDHKFINFYGDIDLQSGFGNCSYYLLKETANALQVASIGKTFGVRDQTIFACQNRQLDQSGVMVWHDQPREQWLYSPFKKNIAIIPWETTVVPKSWIGRINGFDALLTPCKQNIEDFRNSGVKIPIELISWGIDPTRFYPLQRPEREVFTLGHMGALSYRKGTDLLVEAFQEEFPTEQDIKLICKTSYNTYPFDVKDKRIEVLMTPFTPDELLDQFFKQIDCFVFPTRGEGFGMTPLEAMATGVPAIVTGWSGPLEYMTPETGWLIDYEMVPAKNFSESVYKEDCGNWAEPSKEHLKKLMRYAYDHRAEVKEKGQAAAKYVQENWTWKHKIPLYIEALNKHL